MSFSGPRRRGAAAAAIFLCAASCAQAEKPQPLLPVREIVITTKDGKHVPLRAEIARSDEERNKGLMFRTSLADGDGMLFVFEQDSVLSFWMKNTLLPLSIAYISKDGVINEIHDMLPHRLTPVQSRRSLRYALEVPQGWFLRAGIQTGDALQL